MFNFFKKRKKTKPIEATADNFTDTISQHEYALVFFEASWCGACKILHPIINELADENREKPVTISIVDVDNERELAQKFSIRSLPTLAVFKDGNIINQGPGMVSKPRLQEMIDNFSKK